MQACVTYLRISAYSYPALAAYNAGAALYRSFGKTSTTMYLSILSNIINVIGNCIGVFALHAGVAGVSQSIWSVASLMGMSSMGPVFITVIGQCMGAGDIPQAEYYFKKLLKISVVGSIVWNGVIFALTPILMHFRLRNLLEKV